MDGGKGGGRKRDRERETQTKGERGGKRKNNDRKEKKCLKGARSVRGKTDIKNTVRNTNI